MTRIEMAQKLVAMGFAPVGPTEQNLQYQLPDKRIISVWGESGSGPERVGLALVDPGVTTVWQQHGLLPVVAYHAISDMVPSEG